MLVSPNVPRREIEWLKPKPLISWLAIGALLLYLAFSWIVYTFSVEPLYGFSEIYSVVADSGAYFQAAGIDGSGMSSGNTYASQISLGGSVIGPAIVAKIFRTTFGVALFNCCLFALSIWWAASIPGLKKRTFALLMMLDALTLPALITLNKEILALAGCALFAKYLYATKHRGWILAVCLLVSTMARWQQTGFIFLFLFLRSRRGLRGRPKTAVFVMLIFLSLVWAAIAWRFKSLLAAYTALESIISTGTIARLNSLQDKGLFFLVVWPKILMNVSGRLLQVNYFLTEWIHSDFHELQNTVIGNLHSLALLVMLSWMILKGRFRLARPLVLFALFYMILSSVSPLIQNRYEYPAYALLAMEMARKKESLEPVGPVNPLPPLAPSYHVLQEMGASSKALRDS